MYSCGRQATASVVLTLAAGPIIAAPAAGQIVRDTAVVPDITVPLLNGDSVRLHSLLAPKLTLMVRWSTWCPPCISEMPVFEEFHRKWRDRGVHIVSFFAQDTAVDLARRLVEERGVTYPVVRGFEHPGLRDAMPGRAMPNGYMVKADGKVVIWYPPPPYLPMIESRVEYFLRHYGLEEDP